MAPPLVRLERVSKRYEVTARRGRPGPRRPTALQAVTDFTLDVGAGEFVSIIGPSGCGKTTVLFLLAGLRPPSAGHVEVCGRPAAEAMRSGLASVIFQQPVLFEWLTVEDNVLLPLRMRDPRWWAWPLRRRELRGPRPRGAGDRRARRLRAITGRTPSPGACSSAWPSRAR